MVNIHKSSYSLAEYVCIFNVLFILLTLACICDCLKAFQLNNFKRYELGEGLEDLAFDEDENLISMYWQVYQAYKECLTFNTKLIEEKGKYITSALSYLLDCCILFTIVTFMTFLGYIGLAYDNQNSPPPIIIQLKCEKGSALPERDRKINMTRIAMESFSNSFIESKSQDQKQPTK